MVECQLCHHLHDDMTGVCLHHADSIRTPTLPMRSTRPTICHSIHLHCTAAIPLAHYIATYPLPFNARLHQTLRRPVATCGVDEAQHVHPSSVPVWTLLAPHQSVPRGVARQTQLNK